MIVEQRTEEISSGASSAGTTMRDAMVVAAGAGYREHLARIQGQLGCGDGHFQRRKLTELHGGPVRLGNDTCQY